jgi:predicted nucleotidyltransferase
MDDSVLRPNLVLPVGTQVVTRTAVAGPPGSVGIVIATPSEGSQVYRVRFPDGSEALLNRADFRVRKEVQREGIEAASPDDASLFDYVIYRCVVGSRAYGLDSDDSDVDYRGIYLPPAERHWSLGGVPELIENPGTEEVYWELQKFLVLALKANPNVLECLYTPLVEHATPLARELLDLRGIFLSRLVYQTYNGYVMSQFKKLEQDLRARGAIKWKHAMHLVRLLLSGITVLRDGFVPLRVEGHRDRLLAVRRGEVTWDEVNAWRLRLHQEFDAAYATTKLPERPDVDAANRFLIEARRNVA